MSDTVEGGCLCGNIRFQTTKEPSYQLLCYCTDCQTISGAANFAAYGHKSMSLASINAFALDDRSLFMPLSNHCSESALAWCEIGESLEFFPRIPRENNS